MFSSLRSSVRRRALVVAAGTAVALAAGGGATAAFASTGSSTASTATSASCSAPHLRALLRTGAPAALKADLKKLRAEPKGQRAAERKAIRAKALAGGYGGRVERVAHLFGHGGKGHGWLSTLPAALQTDLKALRQLTPKSDERKAKAEAIAQKALSGGYGATIQQHAQAAQKRIQARCAANS